jgi:hypothetical protein
MPEVNSIVLADGKTTPVNHTFARFSVSGTVAKLINSAATTLIGREILTVETKQPVGRDGAHRIRIGLGMPVEATGDDGVVVSHVSSGEVILNLSQRSTAQERLDLLAILANALASTEVTAAVENVEPFY